MLQDIDERSMAKFYARLVLLTATISMLFLLLLLYTPRMDNDEGEAYKVNTGRVLKQFTGSVVVIYSSVRNRCCIRIVLALKYSYYVIMR